MFGLLLFLFLLLPSRALPSFIEITNEFLCPDTARPTRYSSVSIQIRNSTFTGLSSLTHNDQKHGGTLFLVSSSLIFDFSTISNCKSSYGGGISALETTVYLFSSSFHSCKASHQGGAICVKSSSILAISGSIFTLSFAGQFGGVIS
jgi:hypothetical protein